MRQEVGVLQKTAKTQVSMHTVAASPWRCSCTAPAKSIYCSQVFGLYFQSCSSAAAQTLNRRLIRAPASLSNTHGVLEHAAGDDERNATRPRHIPTMPPDAHTGSPQTPAEGATTVSPRRPSKRTAAAVANLGIAKTLQEQDVETESESSDDEVPTGGASDRVAPRRHKLLATPGGTLPHAWLRVMEQEYGSRHRLDLELQKERAKLAREVR